jgi:hypothetical protein
MRPRGLPSARGILNPKAEIDFHRRCHRDGLPRFHPWPKPPLQHRFDGTLIQTKRLNALGHLSGKPAGMTFLWLVSSGGISGPRALSGCFPPGVVFKETLETLGVNYVVLNSNPCFSRFASPKGYSRSHRGSCRSVYCRGRTDSRWHESTPSTGPRREYVFPSGYAGFQNFA